MGTSFGRGGATTYQQDLANSDCILLMGSNMAENHPVGFQWVVEAKQRGARVLHVDPRFTRTSALADRYVPLRAGTDIAFLGGIIRYILEGEHDFREYVTAYTNASHIIRDEAVLPDDLGGLFSGIDPPTGSDDTSWQYAGEGPDMHAAAGNRHNELAEDVAEDETHGGGSATDLASSGDEGSGDAEREAEPEHREEGGEAFEGGSIENVHHIEKDPSLQDPRCVYQLLKRHYARYTPEFVAETCGVPKEQFLAVAEALCANSNRERTSAIVYSVGWTQHTVGVQYIRAASIVQLLLGNIGRPGGGILALRGHASIQGSTDIPTLFDLLPGYLPMPTAGQHDDLDTYERRTTAAKGYWANGRAYVTSLLKAWWGEHATADNDWCFDHLPRITGDHSAYQTALSMFTGEVRGYFLFGQNPAVGSANSRLHRLALAHLDWLVVRDLSMIESATFWKDAPEVATGELVPEDIGTEVFFLPAAAHVEKDGTFTNTQRLLQWHEAAVPPKGDCRSDLWFAYHLGVRIREKLRAADDRPAGRDDPLFQLTWDYPTEGAIEEPSAAHVLREINGWDADGQPLSSFNQLADDGSTACGAWIYCGCFADDVNQTFRRRPWTEMGPAAQEWGWAWPDDRRMLYSRASADPDGAPWSERKRYVWWDEDEGRWTGLDTIDFKPDMRPDHRPPADATGVDALAGDDPFLLQGDGKGWLWAPSGLLDGPLPTHYEPHESPVRNALYDQQANPLAEEHPHEHNPSNPSVGQPGADAYPYVACSYRIAEHHTAGGMSRFQSRLSELAREMFVEVHPDLAAERGLEHGGWATVISSRTAIEARVLVTERMPALTVQGRTVHQVGLPYHWGHGGIATGDAANDLYPIVLDPNVHIQEVKAATCDVVPGRRPRDAGLRDLVARHAREPVAVRAERRAAPSDGKRPR
ncbi:molybdopterin-dependent oxidoreductase [Nitriliruptoraceae bacterium ZYF776]|nr:molybdopterin-dependent oxidoreductase [Profundirhabdus halotolerans]